MGHADAPRRVAEADRGANVDPIALGAKVIWMQLGIIEPASAQRARDAGLEVVEDRCIKMEHCRFFGGLNVVGLSTGVIGSRRMEAFRP